MLRFAIALLIGVASIAIAAVDPNLKCQDTIAAAGQKYFDARYKVVSKCENRQAAGEAISCGIADPDVAPGLASALTKLTGSISAKCANAQLSGGAVSAGPPCAYPDVTSIATLVTCIVDDGHGEDADNLITTNYDATGVLTDEALRTCQATISKETSKFASRRMKTRRRCAFTLSQGRIAGPCPDAKARKSLGKDLAKVTAKIAAKCTDAHVTDPNLDFGFPCESFVDLTFQRDGVTNNNLVAPLDRLLRCAVAAAGGDADLGSETGYPLREANLGFSNGVAAGDATDTAFVGWTRADATVINAVSLEVSTDPTFATITTTVPGPVPSGANDRTIKLEATGLTADTPYYYRFTSVDGISRTGRIRTAPSPTSTAQVRFGWTGDSNAFFKPFTVLEQILADDPDAWFYIGDTIYGDDPRSGSGVAATLSDYWNKYKENRQDHSLRDLLANVNTYTMWDDHEVTNDFYGTDSAIDALIDDGNEAFRSYMPIRDNGSDPMQLYRSFKFGAVAEFFLIDDRQYRDPQAYVTEPACIVMGSPMTIPSGACLTEINNPARTYLGASQKTWLKTALLASTATWKFIMNGPLVTPLIFVPYDRWDGYAAEQFEILDFIAMNGIDNVVFLSTDIHGAIANGEVSVPGLSAGPRAREWVSGAIGMDPIFRELPASIVGFVPSLPALFSSIDFFDIDRFNIGLVAVDQTQATVTWKDGAGQVLWEATVPAL